MAVSNYHQVWINQFYNFEYYPFMAYDMYKSEKVNGIDNLIFPLLDVTYSQEEIMMISQYHHMVKNADFPVSCQ